MEGLDLNQLTETERDAILAVVRRDEELRKKEQERVTKMKQELKQIRFKGVIKANSGNTDKTCGRCREPLGTFFNKGAICSKCQNKVCDKCQKQIDGDKWLCVFCYKQLEIQAQSGEWFYSKFRKSKRNKRTNKVITGPDLLLASMKTDLSNGTATPNNRSRDEVKRALANNNTSPISQRSLSCETENSDTQSAEAQSPRRIQNDLEGVGYPNESDTQMLNDLMGKSGPKPAMNGEVSQVMVRRVSSKRYDSDSSSDSSDSDGQKTLGLPNQTHASIGRQPGSGLSSQRSSMVSSDGKISMVTDSNISDIETQSVHSVKDSPRLGANRTAAATSIAVAAVATEASAERHRASQNNRGANGAQASARLKQSESHLVGSEQDFTQEELTQVKFHRVSTKKSRSRSPSPEPTALHDRAVNGVAYSDSEPTTPTPDDLPFPSDAPRPRLHHLQIHPNFKGFGFKLHGTKGSKGHVVSKVEKGSPAEYAGLKDGDHLVEVNGGNVMESSNKEIMQRIKAVPNEAKLLVVGTSTLDYYKKRNIKIHGNMANVEKVKPTLPDGADFPTSAPKPRLCNVKIRPDYNGFGFNLHGAKGKKGQTIVKVEYGSPAQDAGLKVGDHIVEVNGHYVMGASHDEVVKKIKEVPNEANILVVDGDVAKYYQKSKMKPALDMGHVEVVMPSPLTRRNMSVSAPSPRLHHLERNPDYSGYGFDLHGIKGQIGQSIAKVHKDSPAQAAGIQVGDCVVEVNGVYVLESQHDEVVHLIKKHPNEVELLVVDHDSSEYYRSKKLKVHGAMPNIAKVTPERTPPRSPTMGNDTLPSDAPKLCLHHLKRRPDFRGYGFKVHGFSEKKGQKIEDVEQDSPAQHAGLKVGDQLVEVNGKSVLEASHKEVIQHILAVPSEVKILVVDQSAIAYYKERGISLHGAMGNVEEIAASAAEEEGEAPPGTLTLRHESFKSTQSDTSVPSISVTHHDTSHDGGDDDIDALFKSHGSSISQLNTTDQTKSTSNLASPLSQSHESIASFYSDAGEGVYGKVPVTGEIQFGLEYNYKTGHFEVKVKQCKDIAPIDAKKKRSDSYVKTYLLPDKSRGGKRKTKVKKHSLSPVFEEVLRYHITKSELETRTLWVSIWHNDRFGHNAFLGEVMIPLDYYHFDETTPKWYRLQDRRTVGVSLSPTPSPMNKSAPSSPTSTSSSPMPGSQTGNQPQAVGKGLGKGKKSTSLQNVNANPMAMLAYKGDLILSLKYMPPELVTNRKKKKVPTATLR